MFVLLFVVIIVLIALGPPKRVFQRVAVQGQFCPEKSNHRMLSLRRLFSEQVVQVILCDGIEDALVL